MKDSASLPATRMNDHIAIVASVPNDATITDPVTYMKNIILIEGEFTSKIQSVIRN